MTTTFPHQWHECDNEATMNLKERYQHFKKWQREPFHYKNTIHDTVHCANCGTEFTANYCPVCGQKANVGRINWETVRQGIMLLWGMESRSLGYTLLQLLLRPGYLIGDYLSGRRQISFPPVKMLVIVTIAGLLINKLVSFLNHKVVETDDMDTSFSLFNRFADWGNDNPGWFMLAVSCVFILPTWATFRHAPQHTRHTLPEGFFIQVFMSTLILVMSAIIAFTSPWVMCLIPFYFVVAYKQIFGYGLWGTLWRLLVCCIEAFLFFAIIIYGVEIISTGHAVNTDNTITDELFIIAFFGIVGVVIAAIVNIINKRTAKHAVKS